MADRDESRTAPRRAAAPAEPRSLTFGQHVVAFVKELTAVVVGAVIVASLLRGFVGQMFLIPSISMENTLRVDDRVVVQKVSGFKRGQVVVFKDPGGWLTGPPAAERGPIGRALQFVGVLPDPATEHLIKRVIGVAGDRVICCDSAGRITVNGQPLEESGYLYASGSGETVAPSSIPFEVVVPKDRIFVMGDNRNRSRDSRCHLNDVQAGGVKGENAFVEDDLVVGSAMGVVWPFARRHTLPIPDTFKTVPRGTSAPSTPEISAGPEANC
ncbi:MAG TPA: signal peptidase I [Propionibacteriaceae bacterium]|nr:signal peptidase I [Propionibacteriaceae bacterium]